MLSEGRYNTASRQTLAQSALEPSATVSKVSVSAGAYKAQHGSPVHTIGSPITCACAVAPHAIEYSCKLCEKPLNSFAGPKTVPSSAHIRQPGTNCASSMICYPSRAVAPRQAASRPRLQLRCCATPQRRGGRPPRAVSTELPAVAQPAIPAPAPKRQFSNANFPTDAEGRTYHLGTKRGEVANRLLSVGSTDRAILLSQFLEPPRRGQPLLQRLSKRGFLTVTGKFNGQPVSIVSTMMGMPNMDFVVRENRAVVDGEMAVVRLGTCGAVQPPAALGHLMVAAASIAVRRDPDAFAPESEPHAKPYTVSRPIPADVDLVARLAEAARAQVRPCTGSFLRRFLSAGNLFLISTS